MAHDYIWKLGLALFLGLLIGIDRQLKKKPVGIKTCMIISVASCLITIVSIESVHIYSVEGHTNMDPMRLAAQVVSGVGFLGAGVILRRNNDVISGLTTASMVWAASGLGIAVGAGFILQASAAVVIMMLAINVFPSLLKLLGPKSFSQRDLLVKIIVDHREDVDIIFKEIKRCGMKVKHVKLKDIDVNHSEVQMIILASEKQYTTHIYRLLKSINGVDSVELESR
ncbi:MgtC/SapB family protein [Ammoniphilus sp. CFH 90114]|uniref:MgtC/SapB family protein n=1 Tax=Ammoniphilus sp. CFH 90114 TaxID=2493665 RepID=UPI00100F547F|nr:MgtC/SapB family protein [Ammoniphilus sp. CFH 90114]RXT05863.1 MgtC/SapB family protein [Ammoniphilus sp. CFH 90114]